MLKISNSDIINFVIKILIFLVVAKGISLLLWVYLPNDGVDLEKKLNYKPTYQRVDFRTMIESPSKRGLNIPKKSHSNGISITNMILKGLYGDESKGYAILALKSNAKKTSIISVEESFSGYTLKSILSDRVVFEKNGREYILDVNFKKLKGSITKVMENQPSNSIKFVSRNDISFYSKNPSKIWDDISIKEVKNNGKIYGFKIYKIKKNSRIYKLGLQKNDVLIRANNIDLRSYDDAINLYKNMNKLKTISIVVLRNNNEKEFVYEIN